MRIVIVTQEEPFYLPIFMAKVLKELNEVAAVIILPGIPKGFTRFSYVKRLYDVFGMKAFLAYSFLFVHHRFLDLLSRWRQPKRFYSVKAAAKKNSVQVYRLRSINDSRTLELLKTLKSDITVSVAAPQVFKQDIISSAKHTLNAHAALLPEYQGMMPSFWVLAKGEVRTGVTVHYIDENIDRGDIIEQEVIDISPEETLHSLQEKVAETGAVALIKALQKIERGNGAGTTPVGNGSYYSFPTKEAAKEFRNRGRRFI